MKEAVAQMIDSLLDGCEKEGRNVAISYPEMTFFVCRETRKILNELLSEGRIGFYEGINNPYICRPNDKRNRNKNEAHRK